jgi:hypothetical protein
MSQRSAPEFLQPAGQPPHDPSSENSWTLTTQEKALDRISEWIRATDSKTAPILALDSALTATLVGLAARPGAWTPWTGLWIGLGSALLVASLVMVAFSTSPRLVGRTPSLIYFGDIAALPVSGYAASVLGRTRADYLNDLIAQCHQNAEIATAKFRWARYATLALIVGVLPWLAAIFFVVAG